jgi:hypothetical protein
LASLLFPQSILDYFPALSTLIDVFWYHLVPGHPIHFLPLNFNSNGLLGILDVSVLFEVAKPSYLFIFELG